MKKAISILALSLALSSTINAQPPAAQLVCDSTTQKRDTVKGDYLIYLDITSGKVESVKTGYAVRVQCRLMYQGINGAPNAPTNQTGVKEVQWFIAPGKPLDERYIIKFITKQ